MRTIYFLLILLATTYVSATNYYVSSLYGDDSNNGLTINNPFATIQYACEQISAGDTVFVADGTYAGFDFRDNNGTANAPIVFKAMTNTVVLNQNGPQRDDIINIEECNYVVIDGFTTNDATGGGNGIRIVLSNHCVVRNCMCNNNAERGIFTGFTDDILIENNKCSNSVDEHGIYVSNSSDRPIIRYNECYGNNGCGIHMNGDLSTGGDGTISDAQVYGNIVYDNNGGGGINMDGVENPLVYNNLIYNNHSCQGIVLFGEDGAIVSHGAKIYNNTIIVPSDGRWGILVKDGANINTEIYNNIIINNHSFRGCVSIEDDTDFSCDYNIINNRMSNDDGDNVMSLSDWQDLGFGTHSLVANEMSDIFIDVDNDDFHLKDNSQAINTGTNNVNTVVTDDIEQKNRPIGTGYDIGAYEYGTATNLININKNTFNIYPNPATNNLQLVINNEQLINTDIVIYNIAGQIVRQFKIQNSEFRIQIDNLQTGVYFLRIGTISKKLIIK